jgi:hypothetical protein
MRTPTRRARAAIEDAVRKAPPGEAPYRLTREQAAEVLACFDVPVQEVASQPGEYAPLGLKVRQHPVFGPVIVLGRAGQQAVVRITPLTDQDVRVMLKAVGMPPEGSELELLCRLSQLIEELPWVAELEAELVPGNDGKPAMLGGVLVIAVNRPE